MQIFIAYEQFILFYFHQFRPKCFPVVVTEPELPTQSCYPSPCGPYSVCELEGPRVVCSCQKGYFGRPPNCHPECLVNGECPPSQACIREKCLDPCQGTCGINALCTAVNHQAICSCPPGYTGDPFETCSKIPGRSMNISFDLINLFFRGLPILKCVNNINFFPNLLVSKLLESFEM